MRELSSEQVDARMRQIVAEMAVISEASGVRHGDVVHGGTPNRAPKGPKVGMAEEHALAYMSAAGPTARREALQAAEKALTNARYAPRRSMVAGTLEWRLAIASDTRPVSVIAEVYGVSERHVYRMRAIARRAA